MTDLQHIPYNQLESKCMEVLQAGRLMDPTCMDVHLQIANCMIEKDEGAILPSASRLATATPFFTLALICRAMCINA